QVAQAMGLRVPDEPDPRLGISLTYKDFLGAIDRMREVDFPIERDPAEAWEDFVGWRVKYEQAAYALPAHLHAVPALWARERRPPAAARAPATAPAAGAAPQISPPAGPRPAAGLLGHRRRGRRSSSAVRS